MKRFTLLTLALLIIQVACRADEGMWIPLLLKKYNIENMQKQGFKLTAEDIYDINQASLKDAVIGLGREGRPFQHFCTGEMISAEGLVVTNHHCSFDMIQNHSSLEHNYLRDGFWAQNRGEELANPGITASILVRMEDVTDRILSRVTKQMSEKERSDTIAKTIKKIEQQATEGTNLQANIKPYFNGNQYFMSIFKIYRDVRLVGAPASSIGKFGGDTDNWMWPRHTGDFSVLRVYADANNEPAAYAPENKPYNPARFLKVSTKGINEGDFTMVFGYPGTTNEYLTSYAVEQMAEVENPAKITIRTAKLNIMNDAMESSELLRIKYASKAAGVANSWKKWQGEIKGLKRFNTIQQKQQLEQNYRQWATSHKEYDILDRYEKLYNDRKPLIAASAYLKEAGLRGAEIVEFAQKLYAWTDKLKETEDTQTAKKEMKQKVREFYKDYDAATDKKIMLEMMSLYHQNMPKEQHIIENGNYTAYVDKIYQSSILADEQKINNLIDKANGKSLKTLDKDPACILANTLDIIYTTQVYPQLSMIDRELTGLDRTWLAGLMQMEPDKTFYADANSTLRISYGKIEGYSPMDAVQYKHYTTLDGIMEKDNPDIYDYDIPKKLRDAYAAKDFGPYTQDGQIPVCFIATNHTTGGNSGSPVLNANGELIGINFDRAWDGVMSDIQYNPEICRNIAIDIRYLLFVIDKIAGAGHLIDEMELVKE